MSTLTMDLHESRALWPAWREHTVALGVALALHAGLAFVLLNLSHNAPLPPAVSAVITTQLITLPAPVVQPPPPLIPEVAAAPPAPLPEPVVEAPQVEQADLAFKRVEQERKEKAQKLERERQQRREEEQRQEQLAREEQQRQTLLQEQQLAQARQAEADRQAAAAAAAKAEAEAASRQYLPIAKQAPDYPQRALDRKIEGECTVAYRVSAQGRVEDPQVVGECHPLFVKPSLAAAKTFRYQPRVVNGQAVAVASVKNTFSYKIQ
ncbi:energy transducer TonB [Pseudomonas oleovorans]|uniref:energy transducer TonB n=1 Tax=Ectopseudomonas oleovorans TaxID=301 RepID=UPI0025FFA8AD|nr:energy transducer TonB [Pseudomonas oleovorans]MCW1938324.1 energy transducer TonB [Pseudomonas sp. MDMC_285]